MLRLQGERDDMALTLYYHASHAHALLLPASCFEGIRHAISKMAGLDFRQSASLLRRFLFISECFADIISGLAH